MKKGFCIPNSLVCGRLPLGFVPFFFFFTSLFAQMEWICATDSAGWSGRSGHASVVFDDKIWIFGGLYYGYINDVWYSTDGVNWTQAIDSVSWSRRVSHTSVIFDNKIWVLGGNDRNRVRNDVWYSSDGVNWIQATHSAGWSARDGHSTVVFDNKIWVLGGWDYSGKRNDVWYSVDGNNWTQATISAGWSARAVFTSVVFDNKIWVFGGLDEGGSRNNDVWYSADGVNWTQATASAEWINRVGHTSVVFDNKIWVLGGEYIEGSLNDVWYSRGLGIEETITPNAKSLTLRVSPVLFTTNVKITYNLPKSALVRLSIYDSSGKEVKALFNGKQVAGFHELNWNGKDNASRKLPAGAYFLKLKANGSTTIKKIVKLE
jgi:hypothetical protein